MSAPPPLRPELQVAVPPRPWVLPLGVGAAVAAGAVVLVVMNQARLEKADPAASAPLAGFEPPPPPLQPLDRPEPSIGDEPYIPAPYMTPQSATAPGFAPPPMPAAPAANSHDANLRAPAVVVDLGLAPAPAATPASPALALVNASGSSAKDVESDEAFAQRVSGGVQSSAARAIGAPSRTAAQGTVLPAVLETAINSDVPGFVRAVVSRDVRAFDGATVVIPRGSKLVGQYRNTVTAGQSRAFVIWTRCIRPDGIAIDLGSPAVDPLGQAGLAGETDRHFFRRFGAAMALSVLTSGLSAAGDRGDRIVIGSAQDASRVAEIALQKQIDIPPTIRIPQGAPLSVFLARDLVFGASR